MLKLKLVATSPKKAEKIRQLLSFIGRHGGYGTVDGIVRHLAEVPAFRLEVLSFNSGSMVLDVRDANLHMFSQFVRTYQHNGRNFWVARNSIGVAK